MSNLKQYENRIIAMLDILGLSVQIKDPKNLPIVLEKYKKLIKQVRETIFFKESISGSKEPYSYNFEIGEFVFDTLVLVSYPIDVKSSCKFVLSVIEIMELFAKQNMPLRGAIGIGDYCVDDETNIFLSNIFKSLSKEETNQRWSGCVLLPENEDMIISNILGTIPEIPKQSDVFHLLDVPNKKSANEKRWCINWIYKMLDDEIESILKYMEGDSDKHENTRLYIDYLKSLPYEYQILPPDYFPAVKMKAMKTRASLNIRFEDKQGLPVEPGCENWSLNIFK